MATLAHELIPARNLLECNTIFTHAKPVYKSATRAPPGYVSSDMALRLNNREADGNITDKTSNLKYRVATTYAPFVASQYMPAIMLAETDNKEITLLSTPATNAIKEQEAAWIMGEGDVDAVYNSFISNPDALGLPQMREIQFTYEARLGRLLCLEP